MSAGDTGTGAETSDDAALAGSVCMHAIDICDALERGVTQLQQLASEPAGHADALIELAIRLAAPDADASCGQRGDRP